MPNGIKAREGKLQVEGLNVDYRETGAGDPLIVIPARDGEPSGPLMNELAKSHRVLCLDLSNHAVDDIDRWAERLARAIASLGIGHYSVVGTSSNATHALALARSAPEAVEKLILLSPLQAAGQSFQADNLLRIKADTLVLVGTRDISGTAEAGRLLRAKIPACHLSFVYGATHTMVRDRITACADTIRDFLAHGEQFIIEHQSQMIRP